MYLGSYLYPRKTCPHSRSSYEPSQLGILRTKREMNNADRQARKYPTVVID